MLIKRTALALVAAGGICFLWAVASAQEPQRSSGGGFLGGLDRLFNGPMIGAEPSEPQPTPAQRQRTTSPRQVQPRQRRGLLDGLTDTFGGGRQGEIYRSEQLHEPQPTLAEPRPATRSVLESKPEPTPAPARTQSAQPGSRSRTWEAVEPRSAPRTFGGVAPSRDEPQEKEPSSVASKNSESEQSDLVQPSINDRQTSSRSRSIRTADSSTRPSASRPVVEENQEELHLAEPTPAKSAEIEPAEKPASQSAIREEKLAKPEPVRSRTNSPRASTFTNSRSAIPTQRASRFSSSASVLNASQGPQLSVETSGPAKIQVGKEGTYVVRMANLGDAAAETITFGVAVPHWAEVARSSATAGTARATVTESDGTLVEWHINALDARRTADLTLQIVPREGRPFDLTMQWQHAPSSTRAVVEVQEPKLAMKITGPEEVDFGGKAVYELSVTNPGTGDAENTVIRLYPPGEDTEPSVTHNIGTVAAGGTKSVELELAARQSGTLVIRADALADGDVRASVRTDVLVRRAELQVAMSGPEFQYAGTVATFVVQISNPGNAVARDVNLQAVLPSGASYVESTGLGKVDAEGDKVAWNIGTLQPGEQKEIEVRCKLNTPGVNRPQALATAAGELKSNAGAATRVEAVADLVLDVIDPRGPIRTGQEIEYEISIRNRGTKAAEGVDLSAVATPGLELLGSDTGHKLAGGRLLFETIGSVPAGKELVFKVRARALRAGNHNFGAMVEGQDLRLSKEESTQFYGEAVEPIRQAQRLPIESMSAPGEREPLSRQANEPQALEPLNEAAQPLEPQPPVRRYGEPTLAPPASVE